MIFITGLLIAGVSAVGILARDLKVDNPDLDLTLAGSVVVGCLLMIASMLILIYRLMP